MKISNHKNYKWIRYLKIFLSNKVCFILISSCIISNTIVLFQNYQYKNLYNNIETAEFVATVISDETIKEYKSVYTIKVEQVNKKKKYSNTKLLLYIKEAQVLQYGDKISFTGEYKKPQSARNEKGFDYAEYLKTIGVYGSVETNKNSIKVEKKNNVNPIFLIANKTKQIIMKQCNKILKEENAKLLQGFLLGETGALEEETIENFRNSSLYHMLAVSGAHISYLIVGCQFLFYPLTARNRKIATILVLFFFMFVTNFSLSVVRASIMGSLVLGAEIIYKKSNFINNINIALLFVLIQNPYAIKSLSVLLSFGGTLGIVYLSKDVKNMIFKEGIMVKKNSILEGLKEKLIVTISAQIMIIPIIWTHFHTFSFTFFISNGLASILIGPIIILGFLSILFSLLSVKLATIISIILNLLLSLLKQIAKYTSNMFLSNVYVVSIPSVFIIMYYLGLTIFHFYQKISLKEKVRSIEKQFLKIITKINYKKIIIILIILVIIFCAMPIYIKPFTIYFIDVGQGDSCLIITKQNKKILIDGGGSEFSSFDVGEKTLIPYLLNRGVKTLDCVMISHFDTDHCGGILSVLESLKVNMVIITKQGENSENYQRFQQIVKQKKIKVKEVKAGERVRIDTDTYFDILWPQDKQISENILNNNSIVAKLIYREFTMLFTGDIEEIAEKEIIKKYETNNNLKSTILKVSHHGSKSSSIQEILEKIQPKIAIIGVGENNKFGHPNEGVLERLENINCKIYRTDLHGEIILEVDRKGNIKSKTKISR